jgi:phosphoglycerate dehydrogenase-like enzyme
VTPDSTPIAVTSRSFSRHPVLRAETLERYSDVRFNDEGVSLRGDALAEFLSGRAKAITALEPIDDALLERLPDLRVISKVGVGTDMIDQEALRRRGVHLSTAAGTNSRSVAELVVAYAISLLRHVPVARDELRDGGWRQPKGGTLSGRTVGIVGYGHVGRDVARLVRAFGCPVLAHDVRPLGDEEGVEAVDDLDVLLETADVVTLHVNLTEDTRGLIGAARLGLMKNGSVLINTARGGLVDEAALKEALRSGPLAAAALDVFDEEPPTDRELLEMPNLLATPHIGGSTEEAILAMGRAAIAGLDP